ncbi:MAG: sugar ABC transporter permease [Gaiellaceae bacterium]
MSGSASQPAAGIAEPKESFSEALRDRWNGIRAGDVGNLPIILALFVIAIFFQTKNSHFDDPGNIVNLVVQMAGYTTIAIGVVFVLLLGEIDLSIAFVSGVCGVVAAKLVEPAGTASGWPVHTNGLVAILAALATGAAIGLLQGTIIVKIGIPSFVVTLAGLLAWQGVVLIVIGNGGTIPIQDKYINGISNSFFSHATGAILAAAAVALYAAAQGARIYSRRRAGLATGSLVLVGLKIAILALVAWFVVHYTYKERGIPYVGLIIAVLLVGWSYMATRTRFGRHVYAVGGNAEASRRAGISVDRIRILGFVICSTMAALGGVILASRLQSVDTEAGGGTLLIDSIAAAVIGGASLFGGRGHPKNALFGALVIASLANGMGLLGYTAGVQDLVTGLILLAAVTVDAVSRKRLEAAGR